ncbi:MAG: AAA family ATPase, partial [Bryobacteraceae bacterium]
RPRYIEWEARLRNCFPLIERVYARSIEKSGFKNLFVKLKGIPDPVSFDSCGTGIVQCALSLYAVMYAPEWSVVLLDESTHHLHPFATKAFLRELTELSIRKSVIAVTHDMTAIQSPLISSIILIRRGAGTGPEVAIVKEEGKIDVLREIGLDQADLLFADGVLIAEGASEESILREAQKDSLFPLNIGIASLNGLRFLDSKQSVRRDAIRMALNVLKASKAKPTWMKFVLDADQRKSERNDSIEEDLNKAGVKLAILKRRCLENYFLDARLILEIILELRARYELEDKPLISLEGVESDLTKLLLTEDLYQGKVPESLDDKLARCNAPELLQRIFSKWIPGSDYLGRKSYYALEFYLTARKRKLSSLAGYLAEVSEACADIKKG